MAHQGSWHRANTEDIFVRARELHVRTTGTRSCTGTFPADTAFRLFSIFDPTVWERVRKEFVLEFSALVRRTAARFLTSIRFAHILCLLQESRRA